jgi:hypothetical protein
VGERAGAVADARGAADAAELVGGVDRLEVVEVALLGPRRIGVERGRVPREAGGGVERRARPAACGAEVAVELLEHALEVGPGVPGVPRGDRGLPAEHGREPRLGEGHGGEHALHDLPRGGAPPGDRGLELGVARGEPEIRGVRRGGADDLAILDRGRALRRAEPARRRLVEVHVVAAPGRREDPGDRGGCSSGSSEEGEAAHDGIIVHPRTARFTRGLLTGDESEAS